MAETESFDSNEECVADVICGGRVGEINCETLRFPVLAAMLWADTAPSKRCGTPGFIAVLT